ncbi:uncharacterized protein LOC143037994 isoform X2 [Oratosquilla oratoria]|uniref:uncharacterized protein LOC143037994 isoform X2 n=1 Tax=Oratosquilla oratoria TaxID=337810 RepID=UPI003F75950C
MEAQVLVEGEWSARSVCGGPSGVWMCTFRQLRRLVRRRTVSLLLVITVLLLMSLSVTPPPALAEGGTSHVSLGHRRIQQQGDDDYTGPKPPPPPAAADPEAALQANDLAPPPPPPKEQLSTNSRRLDGYVLPKEKPRGGEPSRVFSLSVPPRRTSPSVPEMPFLKAESPSGQSRIIAGRTVPQPWLASRPSNLSLQDATPFRERPRGSNEEGPYNLPILKGPDPRPQRYGEEDDVGVGHVQEVVRKGGKRTFVQQKPEGNVIATPSGGRRGGTNESPGEVFKTNAARGEAMVKVQLSALTALQHGHKLTHSQQKAIEGLTPSRRRILEDRVKSLRMQQDRVYLSQLRTRRQIRPLPGGGEQIVSSSIHPIRFPAAFKKMKVEEWPNESRVFLNLTHYPWAQSENCKNFSTTFAKPKSLPTAALASFPSSGNTWVRYLIDSSTGIYTGSMYDDNSLTRRGMFGEGVPYDAGITILQKSHGYTTGDAMKLPHEERVKMNHMEELGNGGIIVVRNPFKALISHRHLDVGGHTGYAPKAHFIGEGWKEFITLKIGLWKDFYIDWLTYSKPERLHVINYENLKNNLAEEMKKALKFLKVPIDEKRLRCIQEHSDGLFKRKPPKNNPLDFDPFTLELKNIVYTAIDEVNRALLSHNKNTLPLELYEMYDNHEAEAARRLLKQE